MRVIWSGTVLGQGVSGIGTYILETVGALARRGNCQLEVYAPESTRELFSAKVQFHPSPRWCNWHAVGDIAWHQTALPSLAKGAILHIPTIRRLPYRAKGPLVVSVHDLAPLLLPEKYGRLRYHYHRHFLHRQLPQADAVVVPSRSTREDLARLGFCDSSRIHVVYEGVEHGRFFPGDSERSAKKIAEKYGISLPYLAYVARIEHPGKNHLRLIEAFERFGQGSLLLAGPDWNGAEVVRKRAEGSPLAEKIHFLGCIPKEDLVDLYRGARLVVFPSLYEGFGLPLLEAIACAAPVTCSNTSSLKELAPEWVHTFDPYNPKEIANALASTWEGGECRSDYAASFTWEKSAEALEEIYRSIA